KASSLSNHFSVEAGGLTFTSSPVAFSAQAVPSDAPSVAPVQRSTLPDNSLTQAAIVAAQSVAVSPLYFTFSGGAPTFSSATSAATVNLAQGYLPSFHHSESIAGSDSDGLQNEDDLRALPNKADPARLPATPDS